MATPRLTQWLIFFIVLLRCAPLSVLLRSVKIVSIDVRYLMQDLGMEVHIVSKVRHNISTLPSSLCSLFEWI